MHIIDKPRSLKIGRYEVGQWESMSSLVRTTRHATLIPMLCADRNRNSLQSCWNVKPAFKDVDARCFLAFYLA